MATMLQIGPPGARRESVMAYGRGKARLLPTARDVEWLAGQVAAEKRRAAEGRHRPLAGRPVQGDDIGPPPRLPGRPVTGLSVASRIAALAPGAWFDCPGRPATVRKNAHGLAKLAGVRVSVAVVGNSYRVTRIPDDTPAGRWPEKTPV